MEKSEKIVVSNETKSEEVKNGWDIPHCLFIFGDKDSAENDLKKHFEITD